MQQRPKDEKGKRKNMAIPSSGNNSLQRISLRMRRQKRKRRFS